MGNAVCWGDDAFGQSTPPGTLGAVSAIAAGGWHSLAIQGSGPTCDDGLDNDGDGFTDFAGGDPGCVDANDLSENDPTLPCDDGIDNDDDGRTDFDPETFADPAAQAGSGDPGCKNPTWPTENPECDDGVDNDDNDNPPLADWDGGYPGGGGARDPDPQCSAAWDMTESRVVGRGPCGLGAELAVLLPPLMWLSRRRSLH